MIINLSGQGQADRIGVVAYLIFSLQMLSLKITLKLRDNLISRIFLLPITVIIGYSEKTHTTSISLGKKHI